MRWFILQLLSWITTDLLQISKAWCQEDMNLWGAFIFSGEAWRKISIREFHKIKTENKCQTLFKQWSYQPFDLDISLSKWDGWWKVRGRVSRWKLPLIIQCNSLFLLNLCWGYDCALLYRVWRGKRKIAPPRTIAEKWQGEGEGGGERERESWHGSPWNGWQEIPSLSLLFLFLAFFPASVGKYDPAKSLHICSAPQLFVCVIA